MRREESFGPLDYWAIRGYIPPFITSYGKEDEPQPSGAEATMAVTKCRKTGTDHKCKYKFSGHQTFTFRYGWLEKGVRGVAEYSDMFFRDDALVLLGVGKNMVDSIRHWCQVTQLVELDPNAGKNSARYLRPTKIASQLLFDDGWDPFLEDDASLWLIHWLLATNPLIGTTWQLLFAKYNRPDFTRREITNYITYYAAKQDIHVRDSVIARDIDCLIRTYVMGGGAKKQTVAEESFACPLLQLNLIQPSPDGELYRFAIGPKPSLPTAVFAYALHEYFGRREERTETMSIQECLYGEGSPGQVFKLDENSLIEYVEILEDTMGGDVVLDETAGLKQIYRRQSFDPVKTLDRYYGRSSQR